MSKFDTEKNKLFKLWESNQKNENDLTTKDNKEISNFFNNLSKQQIQKNIIELYNSEFFTGDAIAPSDPNFITLDENNNLLAPTVYKNTTMPITYRYEKSIELDIPEFFLPFIKVVPEIKQIPDYNLNIVGQFIASRFNINNDIVQIKGDGAVLYTGSPELINSSKSRVNSLLSTFTSEELTTYNIYLQNTKKNYEATVIYTRDGDQFQIKGNITRLIAVYDLGASCNPNNNEDRYDALVFQEGTGSERYDNEFLDLTSSTFSIKAQKREQRYVDVPPCTDQSVTLEGVTFNSTFASATEYQMQIIGEHINLTTSTFLGNNQKVTVNTFTDTINSQEFELVRYRAYYDNKKQGVLSVKETGNPDGNYLDEFELDPSNLPNTDKGHTLTYSNIRFFRNLGTFDRELHEENSYIQHTRQPIKVYMKKSDGSYFVTFYGTFLLTTPVTKVDPNSRQFPEYNDTYAVSGNTYDESIRNHSFADTPIYIPEVIDTEIRLRIFLQNPLYWKENKKYDI